MGTRRIVEQIITEATQIGCLTGVALGAGYGVLLPLGFVLPYFFQSPSLESLGYGVIFVLIAGSIGLGIGCVIGGLAGMMLGLSSGLAVAWLTVACYTPMHNPDQFRWSVRLTSVFITLLGNLLVSLILGRVPSEDGYLYFVGIPLFLTLPCGWWAGSHLADRYLAQLDQAG